MLHNFIHIYPTPAAAAKAVANRLIEMAKRSESLNRRFHLALSGGSTPNILFGMLAGEFAQQINWDNLRIFWVDERCVPPTDPESNFGTVREILLRNVPIPRENVFNVNGDNDPLAEAARYRAVLAAELPAKNGLPVFDLVLLGMGDDGHTASIFPDRMDLLHTADTVAVATHPQSKQQRITLTGNVIAHAEHVFFLITGAGKAETLASIMQEKGDFSRFPTYHILRGCSAEIFLDDAAGAGW